MDKYAERLNDIVILQLDTQGFDALSENQKQLSYHLSEAGLWGRFISLDQGSIHNIAFFNALIALYEHVPKEHILHEQLHHSLFIVFAHNGIYHSTSGERLNLPLKLESLNSYLDAPELVESVRHIWFETPIAQFRTVQKEGVDVISQ